MPTTMPNDQERQRMIRSHLKQQEDDAGGKDKLPPEKLVVKGRAEREPVYRLALQELAFNKANGRIKAEVLEKEAELGRDLAPSSPEDQKIIKEILLSIRPDENTKIRDDLKKNGQMHPGIITCDGIVVNGNRRKALLEELCDETGDEQFKYLDIQVLPSDITKAELWLIEAGIQMSTPQQLDYSPINHLLKLREGYESGLRIEDMAARIYGVSEDNITVDLERLKLIDEYLDEFLKKPNRYYLVKQLNEHFIDLQDILNWASRPRGNVQLNWQWDKSDINELKLIAFYYIRIRFPHLRIRGLRDLFPTRQSWQEVKQAATLDVDVNVEERSQLGLEPASLKETTDEELDDTPDPDTFSTCTEKEDFREETLWKEVHEETLKSFYEDAKEQEQIVKDSVRPLALAQRALRNVEAIPADPKKLSEPEIDDVLRNIITVTNDLRKIIQKPKSKKHALRNRTDSTSRKGTKHRRRSRKGKT